MQRKLNFVPYKKLFPWLVFILVWLTSLSSQIYLTEILRRTTGSTVIKSHCALKCKTSFVNSISHTPPKYFCSHWLKVGCFHSIKPSQVKRSEPQNSGYNNFLDRWRLVANLAWLIFFYLELPRKISKCLGGYSDLFPAKATKISGVYVINWLHEIF